MNASIEGNELVIRLPLITPPRLSESGKSKLVATSGGNQKTSVTVEGKTVTVGVNAYISTK